MNALEDHVKISRPIVDFPRWQDLHEKLRLKITALEKSSDDAWRSISEPRSVRIRGRKSIVWSAHASMLSHPLSEMWMARGDNGKVRHQRGDSDEWSVYMSTRDRVLSSLAEDVDESFAAALRHTCSAFLDKPVELRRTQVGPKAHSGELQFLFEDWSSVPSSILNLKRNIRSRCLPPTALAVAACVKLLNIHPFVDGNGRTSRALFNAVFSMATGRHCDYLPLADIVGASRGGFELRVRDIEVNGNWAPLFNYFIDIFKICSNKIDAN